MKFTAIRRLLTLLAAVCVAFASANAAELVALKGWKLVPTEWADGDSFEIQTEGGETYTLRIYGADCMEWHVTDDSDARRLRAQRRFFGISECEITPQASIKVAKGGRGGGPRNLRRACSPVHRLHRIRRRPR